MKNILISLVCILTVLLAGCSHDVMSNLDMAESYMEEQPEQALALLEDIGRDRLTTHRARARYALLYSMALDKSYIDTTDVEVVMPAVEYYDRHGPAEKAMKAWFYLGREQENEGNYEDAIVSYTRAKELAEETNDVRFKALLASGMADLYSKTYNNEERIACLAEAYGLFVQAEDISNSGIALAELAVAHADAKQWTTADSLFNICFTDRVLDSLSVPYYLLQYAIMKVLQPQPEPAAAIELFSKAVNDYDAQPDIVSYCTYAYALELLGDSKECSRILELIDRYDEPSSALWKYYIYRNRGLYELALREIEKGSNYQDSIVIKVLQQSISRTLRDYFHAKAELIEHDRDKQKTTKVIFILVLLLVILSAALIIFSIRRNLQLAQDRIASIQSESILYSRELEKKIEISREELGRREKAISDLNRSYIQNYRSQFKLIDELCAEYWMSEHNRDKDKIYNKVSKIVSVIYDGSGKDSEFEAQINASFDNVMQKLRADFPKYKEEDFRLLSYVIAGFEAKTISMIMDLSASNVYSRKSRMKEKILSASTDNTELYRTCL